MENRTDIRKSILNEPSYWIEKLNIDLYDALITYQEKNNLKKGELASYLGISSGRLSQILNDGDSNFNTATLFSILLKLGKYPQVEFVDQEVALLLEEKIREDKKCIVIELNNTDRFYQPKSKAGRPKIIQLSPNNLKLDVTEDVNAFSYELEEM